MASVSDDTTYEVPATLDNGVDVRIFSTGGKHTQAEFQKVLDEYNRQLAKGVKQPTVPSGFTVQMKDSLGASVRGGMLAAQEKVAKGAGYAGAVAAVSPAVAVAERFGLVPKGTTAQPMLQGYSTGRALGDYVASEVNTPGKVGALAGAFATSKAPYLRNTTGIAPYVGRFFGAAGGYAGAEQLTGGFQSQSTPAKLYDTVMVGGIATAAKGADHLVKHALGRSLGQKAYEQVEQQMMAAFAKRYPNLLNAGPEGFKAYAATKGGVQDLTQIGAKAIKREVDSAASKFVLDMADALPLPSDRVTADALRASFKTMEGHAKTYAKASIRFLDNFGDSAAEQKARQEARAIMQESSEKILSLTREGLLKHTGLSVPEKVAFAERIGKIFQDYADQEQMYYAGARLLHYYKKTGQESGFNLLKFQQEAMGTYNKRGALFEDVANAATRGALGTTDKFKQLALSGYLPQALTKDGWAIPNWRNQYTGTIPQVDVSLPVSMTTINEYLKKRE